MPKYSYSFKVNSNGTIQKEQCDWIAIVQYAKKKLDVTTCKLFTYIDTEEFLKRLTTPPLTIGENGYHIINGIKKPNYNIILDIDSYISYIKKYDDGFLFLGNNENPELYQKDKLIIKSISRENYLEFEISEIEKMDIEEQLEIKLKKW